MEAKREATQGGLEGVVVAETRLSDVDGERGRLVVAGHDVERLAGTASFEETAALLWGMDAGAARAGIAAGRASAFVRLGGLGDALDRADGMDSLRASVAHLEEADGFGAPAALTGAVATFAAAWARRRRGERPLAPDPALGHAADYLRMVTGRASPAAFAAGLDAYLVTVADHGMNASTFAARVVASTGSDLISAIVAAVGALKGPLHGGAPGPVLDMLDAIGAPERAAAWIEDELLSGRRIMGMGHRIYRVRDPRAAVLERATLELERADAVTGHDGGGPHTYPGPDPAALGVWAPRARPRRRARRRRRPAPEAPGPPAARQRRVLHGRAPRRDRARPHRVHADLRGGAHGRVDGPRRGAAGDRPAHPPGVALRGAATDAAVGWRGRGRSRHRLRLGWTMEASRATSTRADDGGSAPNPGGLHRHRKDGS